MGSGFTGRISSGLEIKEILRLAPVAPLGAGGLLWTKILSQLYLTPWGMMLSFFTPALLPSFWDSAGKRVFLALTLRRLKRALVFLLRE